MTVFDTEVVNTVLSYENFIGKDYFRVRYPT